MAFFKPTTGSTPAGLKRLEALIWVLIYGGLLVFITGHFVATQDVVLARVLGIVGMIAVAAGVVLIFVRSRLREENKSSKGDTP